MEISSTSAGASRDQFLQLLVTQLRNQDPLAPVQQDAMLAQLAQFSQLEGIEKLNRSFASFLESQEQQQQTENLMRASELIGRHVTYETSSLTTTDGEERPLRTGTVERVLLSDDRIRLHVDGSTIHLDYLVEIATRNSAIVQQPSS